MKRDAHTAPAELSVWRDVPEDEFRKHLVVLQQRTNAVPCDVKVFDIGDVGDHELNCVLRLPLKVEQQIADDIAYIAAVREGAQSVAAACLETQLNPVKLLRIAVAAADSVDPSMQKALGDICGLLMRASADEAGLSGTFTDEIFRLIIALHHSKLLGRMRSCKWTKPQYLAASHKKPLWQDFANVIHRIDHVYPSKRQRQVRETVRDQFQALADTFAAFEAGKDDAVVADLEVIVKATFHFCKSVAVQEFSEKLIVQRSTAQIAAATKCLRQLEKIGAYWRIAMDLVGAARAFSIFQTIELEYLEPYANVPTTIAYESWAKSCSVHAEIQLAVHYDLSGQSKSGMCSGSRPRIIGTSKYLCYLCYLFLTHHPCYIVPNTHGRLYDQWTIPDLEQYNEDSRILYSKVIAAMYEDIRDGTEKPPMYRVEPMTSRQNLLTGDVI